MTMPNSSSAVTTIVLFSAMDDRSMTTRSYDRGPWMIRFVICCEAIVSVRCHQHLDVYDCCCYWWWWWWCYCCCCCYEYHRQCYFYYNFECLDRWCRFRFFVSSYLTTIYRYENVRMLMTIHSPYCCDDADDAWMNCHDFVWILFGKSTLSLHSNQCCQLNMRFRASIIAYDSETAQKGERESVRKKWRNKRFFFHERTMRFSIYRI